LFSIGCSPVIRCNSGYLVGFWQRLGTKWVHRRSSIFPRVDRLLSGLISSAPLASYSSVPSPHHRGWLPPLVGTNHLPPAPEVATVESGENVPRCRPNSNSARNPRDIHSQKCRDGTEIVFLGIQQSMPYASGETPEMGDQISDKRGRVGAVTRITINVRKVSELTIRWNDGIVGILYPVAEDFTLISRAVKSDEQ
jgi:hypothetical protein